jgi:hypothetical protein
MAGEYSRELSLDSRLPEIYQRTEKADRVSAFLFQILSGSAPGKALRPKSSLDEVAVAFVGRSPRLTTGPVRLTVQI